MSSTQRLTGGYELHTYARGQSNGGGVHTMVLRGYARPGDRTDGGSLDEVLVDAISPTSDEAKERIAADLRDLADQVAPASIEPYDIGALDFTRQKSLFLNIANSDKKYVISIGRNFEIEARINVSSRFEPIAIDRIPEIVAYVLRRAICRGIDKSEVFETSQAVTIDLGTMPEVKVHGDTHRERSDR